MLTMKSTGEPVHVPSNPDRFEFDEEVARVFSNMAERSIPGYSAAHELHARLLKPMVEEAINSGSSFTVYDIGSSLGAFFKAICTQVHVPIDQGIPLFNFWAIDKSPFMVKRLAEEMPWVRTGVKDAMELREDFIQPADVICMNYLLQFVSPLRGDILNVLRWAYRNLRVGGVLVLGQKQRMSPTFEDWFSEEYTNFRRRNGYSDEEIRAKTAALKNSMWPITPTAMEDLVYDAGFIDYTETTRWLQFSTSLCVKG